MVNCLQIYLAADMLNKNLSTRTCALTGKVNNLKGRSFQLSTTVLTVRLDHSIMEDHNLQFLRFLLLFLKVIPCCTSWVPYCFHPKPNFFDTSQFSILLYIKEFLAASLTKNVARCYLVTHVIITSTNLQAHYLQSQFFSSLSSPHWMLPQLVGTVSKVAPLSERASTLGIILAHLCFVVVGAESCGLDRQIISMHQNLTHHCAGLFNLLKRSFHLNVPQSRIWLMFSDRELSPCQAAYLLRINTSLADDCSS